MNRSRRRLWILLGLWVLAFAIALLLDFRVAEWVRHVHPINKHGWLARLVRLPGNFVFLIAVALGLALFHRQSWRAAAPLLLSGPLVGIVYVLIKWIVGRRRPVIVIAPFSFHPFIHGIPGLFKSVSGLSFPSGDATMAFAAAGCLVAVFPRWAIAFFLAAGLVAAERVLENAHYLSDVVAGAGLGLICAWMALWLARRLLPPVPPMPDVGTDAPEQHGRADGEIRTCAREP